MKNKFRLLILAIVLVMMATIMSSCADTSYIATVNGTKINSAEYAFLSQIYRISLTKSYKDDAAIKEYLESVDTESNPSETRAQYLVLTESIQSMFEETYIYKQKFTELNLQKDPESLAKLDDEYNQFVEYIGGDAVLKQAVKNLNITEEKFKDLYYDYVLGNYNIALLNYYFSKGGEKAVPDSTFLDIFVNVKHILIASTQKEDMTDAEKQKDAEKKAEAEALLAEIKAGTKDFDTVMKDTAINADAAALETFPDGYIISKSADARAQSQGMVEEFETAAFEMAVGELRLVKTDFGYHIMKKQDLSLILDKNRTMLLGYLTQVNTDFNSMYEQWKSANPFVYNNNTLKKFDIRNASTMKVPVTTSAS